jgi:hypothetical protein
MHEPANYENNRFHFNHLLRTKPGVYRVDSTKRTPELGRWNISTDKKNYLAITTWIDSNISAFFELVPLTSIAGTGAAAVFVMVGFFNVDFVLGLV